jgi:hypothetical protein
MKWTSETPTEKCGSISKKQNTSAVVAAARVVKDTTPCSRIVSAASLVA